MVEKVSLCSVADCGKPGLGRCSRCKVRYCGEECQADDWPAHMRFCFPLPPLEYPDLHIIEIRGSTTSSNADIAGTVGVQETLSVSPGEQPTATAVTKKEGGTDRKDEKQENNNNNNNNNAPAQVEEVPKIPAAPVAAQPITEVGDGNPKPEERKDLTVVAVEDGSSALEVKAATSSTQMATQEVPAGLQDIDSLAPGQIESPANFSISLAAEVKLKTSFLIVSILPFICPGPAVRSAGDSDERQTPRSGQFLDCGQEGAGLRFPRRLLAERSGHQEEGPGLRRLPLGRRANRHRQPEEHEISSPGAPSSSSIPLPGIWTSNLVFLMIHESTFKP